MMDYYDASNEINNDPIQTMDMNGVLSNTFFRMFLGLLASGITAAFAYYSGLYIPLILSNGFFYLAIAEVIVVLVFSLMFRKLSPTAVTVLFFAYAFLNGFTLSVIFAAFELSSIVYAFFGTAALFGALAFLGYKTEKDISSWGTVLTVALVIGLVLTVINLFLRSSALDIALDWAILAIFFGLTVYDMNKIKRMGEEGFCESEKLYVYGAMELYLDFINIFLRVLSLFGKRRN